jgi:hypothetical protein
MGTIIKHKRHGCQYKCRKIPFPNGARLLLCGELSHWLEASDDGLSSLAGREELRHWFKASHRLSSLAAWAWLSPWLEASHGLFSLVLAVPVTQSKLVVVLAAIKGFAALLLNAVSIGSCFKILGNLDMKKTGLVISLKKRRVNAAKLNNARFT